MIKHKMTRNERIFRKLLNQMPSDINCEVSYNRYRDCVTTWISIPEKGFRYLNSLHQCDSEETADFFCDMFVKHLMHYSKTFKKRSRRD